jgi:hypothetical protein
MCWAISFYRNGSPGPSFSGIGPEAFFLVEQVSNLFGRVENLSHKEEPARNWYNQTVEQPP